MSSRTRRIALTLLAPLLFASCLGKESDMTGNGFYVSIPVASLTIPIGTTTNTIITIARAGTFTGPIALTKISVPTGVTVTLLPDTIPVTGTQSTMRITADTSLAQGSYNFGIRATADPNYVVTLPIPIILVAPTAIKAGTN